MFKNGFYVVSIQILGALLGLASLYFIAGDMDPKVYSIVGVYNVVTVIAQTFSDLGIETVMIREALYWKESNDQEKIKEFATQAILSRALALVVIIPFLAVYLIFLNNSKYQGQYTMLFIIFVLGGCVNSINNAMALIARSLGEYVFAQGALVLNSNIVKFAGIALYFIKGADAYLIFYGLSSVPLLFVFWIKLRKLFAFKYNDLKGIFKKVYSSRYLWLKTDLDYIKSNADSLLVSALFPPAIMGSYTVFKSLEQLSKMFVEGFFDVLTQNMVIYKGNEKDLIQREKKIKKARNICILLVLIGIVVYSVKPDFWVGLVRLNKYEGMIIAVYTLAIITIIHLIGKVEINILALFAKSKLNFDMGVLLFAISILSFGIVIIVNSFVGVMMQRVFVYLAQSILAIVILARVKMTIYNRVEQ